jgi:probable rRNA maturation factor
MMSLVTISDIKLRPRFLRLAEAALKVAQKKLPKEYRFPVIVNLLVTDDNGIKQLNRDFRGINKPTNVLSFPQFTRRQIARLTSGKQVIEIGDIAISLPYIVIEAKKERKLLINHFIHMVLHGFLHLLGYDHIISRQAAEMERLEAQILSALGLPDPYADMTNEEPKRDRAAAKKRR